jgi:hypothetical protein
VAGSVVVLSVCLSNANTNGRIESHANGIDSSLQNRLGDYYDLEKEGNWEKTYFYRTPLYRKSINFELYKRKMEEDNKGWKLLEFKIVQSFMKQNHATFRIEFIERVPKGYFPLNLHHKTKITQVSTWEKINDTWYCRDACSRTHLTMNGDLVMRNNQKPICIKP